jgi:hypothetical protein
VTPAIQTVTAPYRGPVAPDELGERDIVRFSPALVLVLLPAALAGCGGNDDRPSAARGSGSAFATASATASAAPTPTPTPTPTLAPAKVTTRVKDCFDGNCRLKVGGPVRIPLNAKKFHYSSLEVVSVTAHSLTYQVPYPQGGGAAQTLGVGGSGSFGYRSDPAVEVRLESVTRGKAVLALTPGKIE